MSKDFILAKTYDAVTKKHSKIYVDDYILEFFYYELNSAKTEYPVLWKIVEDFYGDVVIKPNELLALKKEIKKFLFIYGKKIKIPKTVSSFLKKLEFLCIEGIKKELILWIIAD